MLGPKASIDQARSVLPNLENRFAEKWNGGRSGMHCTMAWTGSWSVIKGRTNLPHPTCLMTRMPLTKNQQVKKENKLYCESDLASGAGALLWKENFKV